MKILIAYDGSNVSDAAVADLARSGLPAVGSALVVSVAEGWVRPDDQGERIDRDAPELAGCLTLARHAKSRVEDLLPGWQVEASIAYGSPAYEILARVEEFDADLVVAGAQGTAVRGYALGPIALRVVSSALSSVRIARDRFTPEPSKVRIAIAFDGSPGSFAAVERVASGRWPPGSEIRVISAATRYAPSGLGRFVEPGRSTHELDPSELRWLEGQAAQALAKLRTLGLPVSFDVIPGSARVAVTEEAARWDADCIYLGAGGGPRCPMIGSTAAAIASRAVSSVEIVREK